MLSKALILALVGLLWMSGCTTDSAVPLPTLIPSPVVDVPTATLPETLPADATVTPRSVERPTLPPTWTPSPEPTAVPLQPTSTPFAETAVPTLVVCGSFQPDRARSQLTFAIGVSPEVFWTPVETAARYRVDIIDELGVELFFDYSTRPSYTFRADLFTKGKRYGWEVYPEDAAGQQMCLKRGGELIPQ